MSAAADHPLDRLAECDWIDSASRAELESLFVWVGPDESVLPPHARKGRPHPSLLMLQRPAEAYGDADLRLAGLLARHLTATADAMGDWRNASFAGVRPEFGQWAASKTTWTGAGSYRTEFRDAAALLAGSVEPDLDLIAAELAAFDERFGHAPAAPSP